MNAAVGLAMDILEESSSSKLIRKDKIVEKLKDIIKLFESEDSNDMESSKL